MRKETYAISSGGKQYTYTCASGRRSNEPYEHRKIARQALGKKLPPGTVVHHVDEDGTNNKHANLVICENLAYHELLHRRERALKICGYANYLWCSQCKTYDHPNKMKIGRQGNYWHKGGEVCGGRTVIVRKY